jgi:hypothetical protein
MLLGGANLVHFLALNIIGVTGASEYDGKVFDNIRPVLNNNELYGDKAYQRPDAKQVEKEQKLTVLTPVKKQKGQKYLEPQEQWLSTAVSRVRSYQWTHGSCIWKTSCGYVFLELHTIELLIHI